MIINHKISTCNKCKKSFYAFLFTLFICTDSYPANPSETVDFKVACKSISDLAEATMSARQSGTPMSKMIDLAKGDLMIEGIVHDAYETPHFDSPSVKSKVIGDFRDTWYLSCSKKYNK